MDVFILVMGGTLATAGWFLIRDYTRFLASGYTVRGEIVGLERAPTSQFFPVIRYAHRNELITFTAIDTQLSRSYQMGDEIPLRVSRSRRHRERLCKSSKLLILMLLLLAVTLSTKALLPSLIENIIEICVASLILTFGVVLMVPYCREQDGDDSMRNFGGMTGRQIFRLSEPAACSHWEQLLDNIGQKRRIATVRLFGIACLGAGLIVTIIGFSGQVRAAAMSLAAVGLGV